MYGEQIITMILFGEVKERKNKAIKSDKSNSNKSLGIEL